MMASYAQVVLGLPVEGPFDYAIPQGFEGLSSGFRVLVPFGSRRIMAFVVGVSGESSVPMVKPIEKVLDPVAVLNQAYLALTRELCEYYCSSWGEMIETGLPGFMKQMKPLDFQLPVSGRPFAGESGKTELLLSPSRIRRWDSYFSRVCDCLKHQGSALIIAPDIFVLSSLQRQLESAVSVKPVVLCRGDGHKQGLQKQISLNSASPKVVIGLRSAVFSQIRGLRVIIVEEEDNFVYKQEQSPHYHARDVAVCRGRLENIDVVLGGVSPSMESYKEALERRMDMAVVAEGSQAPAVSIMDMRLELSRFGRPKGALISLGLENMISDTLSGGGKVMLFSNRSGFAHNIKCPSCDFTMICPRCNLPLVAHIDKKTFLCRKCNYSIPMKDICPNCNASYLHYFGYGIEKLQREVGKTFPASRIGRLDKESTDLDGECDILLASKMILNYPSAGFDLIGVISVDNLLNQVDFRTQEKVFSLLSSLRAICRGRMVVQTFSPKQRCFEALRNNDADGFYRKELEERKELNLPPYFNIISVNVRSKSEEKSEKAALELFALLNDKCASLGAVLPPVCLKAIPFKLRESFRWQISLRVSSPVSCVPVLKDALRNFRHSGVIVTVDVDPC